MMTELHRQRHFRGSSSASLRSKDDDGKTNRGSVSTLTPDGEFLFV